MSIVVAGSVWLAVIFLLIFRRHSSFDHSTIWATVLVGLGLTLNIDPLYIAVDGWMGGKNFADLLANTAIILGMSSLARGISQSAGDSSPVTKIVFGNPARLLTVALALTSFLFIETTGSSTLFMIDYGDQVAAAVYSGVQHIYFGAVMVGLGIVCTRQIRQTRGSMRASTLVLLTGSVVEGVACLDVIFMNTAHVAGNEELLSVGQWIYDVTNPIGIVLLAVGFILVPAARWKAAQRSDMQIAQLVKQLEPAWLRARELHTTGAAIEPSDEQESILYRRIIEIRDTQAALGERFHLTVEDGQALVRAETRLLGNSNVVADHAK